MRRKCTADERRSRPYSSGRSSVFDFGIRPPDALAAKYRSAGVWRDSGPLSDLRRWRDETPEGVAVRAYRSGVQPEQVSFAEFAGRVERFAGALYELEVRPGDVVALQLPNLWQTSALMLAVARLGAMLVSITTGIVSRELEQVLDRVGASVCVTVDRWSGFGHAGALREMAPRLPWLRHRVVLGGLASEEEIEFGSFFEDTRWEQCHPVALDDAHEDPDRVAVVSFTPGASGEPVGALHTWNTLHARSSGWAGAGRPGGPDVVFTPHDLMNVTGNLALLSSLLTGGCVVLLDAWSGENGLALLAETGATVFLAAPPFVDDMITAARGRPQQLRALRTVLCGATAVPSRLVREVRCVFGIPLGPAWSMTGVGIGDPVVPRGRAEPG
ncbi:AMP-binding protein [Pseudonocardia yunnanensis]|uniref:AMP-binding protein n=1 Tax=Pseudonocardia yunnanensis TaxID=58107 RepID=A0ABW4EX71_9PSEU